MCISSPHVNVFFFLFWSYPVAITNCILCKKNIAIFSPFICYVTYTPVRLKCSARAEIRIIRKFSNHSNICASFVYNIYVNKMSICDIRICILLIWKLYAPIFVFHLCNMTFDGRCSSSKYKIEFEIEINNYSKTSLNNKMEYHRYHFQIKHSFLLYDQCLSHSPTLPKLYPKPRPFQLCMI